MHLSLRVTYSTMMPVCRKNTVYMHAHTHAYAHTNEDRHEHVRKPFKTRTRAPCFFPAMLFTTMPVREKKAKL